MPFFVAFIAILFTAGFVFGIDRISGGAVRGYARLGGSAVWTAAAGTTSFFTDSGFFSTRRALEERNRELEESIATYQEQNLRFKSMEEENSLLREMANLAAIEDGITVPVLSSFESSPYGTFRVGGGAIGGIEEGGVVLTPGGFILGAVTFVSPHTATAEAFFAAGKEIEMQVQGVPFVAHGQGGGNARADVPRDAGITEGDIVIVPAFAGRTAGVVGKVESASSSPSATLYIRLPVNLDSLRYVHVLPLE